MLKGTKSIALALAVLMLGGLLAAFAAAEDFDPMAPYDPPITVTFGARTLSNSQFADGHSWDNTVWTPIYEELGIQVDIVWMEDASQYEQKINLAISSGDIPDFMRVYDQQIVTMQKGGMLADLTDIFDQYATQALKDEMLANDGVYMRGAYYDGRLMSLPYEADSRRDWAETIWYRKDWLDNLGLEAPTTMEEFLAVCEAFTNGDPDGNGVDDTYAFGVSGKDNLLTDWGGLRPFFLAYDTQPGWWFSGMLFYELDEDGSVIWSGAKPEMKDALTTLQDMYAKGYIVSDFSTVDSGGRLVEDLTAGKCGIFGGAYWVADWPLSILKEMDPQSDWVAMPAPTATDKPSRMEIYQPASSWTAISANAEHPEAVIKMLNAYCEIMFGDDGQNPRKTEVNGTPGVTDAGAGGASAYAIFYSPRMAELDYRRVAEAIRTKDPSGLYETDVNKWENLLIYFDDPTDPVGWSTHFGSAGEPGYILHTTYDVLTSDRYLENAYMGIMTDQMAQKIPIYQSMAAELITNIIQGQASVDAWDDFVEEWAILGNDAIIAEIEAYRN